MTASSTTLAAGDTVHVPAVGKGIVRESETRSIRGGSQRSRDGAEQHLTDRDGARGNARTSDPLQVAPDKEPTRQHALSSVDGMTTDEAGAALDAIVNDAILAELAQVQVIHSRTGGRLKAAVHGRLKQLRVVRSYRLIQRTRRVTL